MHIQILWDHLADSGLQIPFQRLIESILDLPADLYENPVFLNGFDYKRNQLDAVQTLNRLHNAYVRRYAVTEPVLLVVSQDLYMRGVDFVFGLSRPSAGVAVVSTARLYNSFYGREDSFDDLIDRLSKEGAHEICHLFGLGHCNVPECIMYKPETLYDLDGKKKTFCDECRAILDKEISARMRCLYNYNR